MKSFDIKINGNSYIVDIESVEGSSSAKVKVNGKEFDVQINNPVEDQTPVPADIVRPVKSSTGASVSAGAFASGNGASEEEGASIASGVVTSPLPGVIIGIHVSVGDHVKKGQCLATLEAMKMENAILAECEGTVKKIYVQRGDSILEGAKIIAIG